MPHAGRNSHYMWKCVYVKTAAKDAPCYHSYRWQCKTLAELKSHIFCLYLKMDQATAMLKIKSQASCMYIHFYIVIWTSINWFIYIQMCVVISVSQFLCGVTHSSSLEEAMEKSLKSVVVLSIFNCRKGTELLFANHLFILTLSVWVYI